MRKTQAKYRGKQFEFSKSGQININVYMKNVLEDKADHKDGNLYISKETEMQTTAAINSHAHALVVDDDKISQMVLKRYLESLGYSVNVANDGSEALKLLNSPSTSFDVVTMDIDMPVMDGIQATKQIRNTKSHNKAVKIIGVSARGEREVAEAGLNAGMTDVVSKPISLDYFKNLLTKKTLVKAM